MQRISIHGNIGRDAELVSHNGSQFVSFSVACTTRRKNGENVQESTNWYKCTTESVKLAQYLKAGTKVYVDGNFKLNQYYSETHKKWVPEILIYAQTIELLSAKKEEPGNGNAQPPVENVPPVPDMGTVTEGADLPF